MQHFVWPGINFSWQAQCFRQKVEWKNRKTHWYEAVSSALNFPFLKEVLQNCFVFDVVNFQNCGSLAEKLRFWCCQVQNWDRQTDRQIELQLPLPLPLPVHSNNNYYYSYYYSYNNNHNNNYYYYYYYHHYYHHHHHPLHYATLQLHYFTHTTLDYTPFQLGTQLSIFEGRLAELLHFWRCQGQKLKKSRRIASFLMLPTTTATTLYTLIIITYNYTTLQLQLHYTTATTTAALHYTTLHYIQQLWVRWTLQPLQPLQKTQLQPPFGPSVDSLCHPCITTIHLSYSVLSLKLPPPPCAVLLVGNYFEQAIQVPLCGPHTPHRPDFPKNEAVANLVLSYPTPHRESQCTVCLKHKSPQQ